MFWTKKHTYLDWNEYADIVETWNTIAFSQKTRQESIDHMRSFAETL